MRTHELKTWLLGAHEAAPLSIPGVGTVLGVGPDAVPPAMRQSLRFVLAALRDIYVDELEVWLWLSRPRRDVGGVSPADLLLAGRVAELEALAVHEWNAHVTASSHHRRSA